MSFSKPSAEKPDHRKEVARKKRIAMRSRILNATMKVYSEKEPPAPAIDEIVEAAGISRGGFYRYFGSADEAVEQVGYELTEECARAIGPIYDVLSDPLQRVCIGTFLVLRRAAVDPQWAGFVVRSDLSAHKSRLLDFIYNDLRMGVERGLFSVDDVQAASELVMGINQAAMRVMLTRDVADKDKYVRHAVSFLIKSIGVSPEETARIVEWGEKYLSAIQSGAGWWDSNASEAHVNSVV